MMLLQTTMKKNDTNLEDKNAPTTMNKDEKNISTTAENKNADANSNVDSSTTGKLLGKKPFFFHCNLKL